MMQYRLRKRWVQYLKIFLCFVMILIPVLDINAKIGRGEAASFPWGVQVRAAACKRLSLPHCLDRGAA